MIRSIFFEDQSAYTVGIADVTKITETPDERLQDRTFTVFIKEILQSQHNGRYIETVMYEPESNQEGK